MYHIGKIILIYLVVAGCRCLNQMFINWFEIPPFFLFGLTFRSNCLLRIASISKRTRHIPISALIPHVGAVMCDHKKTDLQYGLLWSLNVLYKYNTCLIPSVPPTLTWRWRSLMPQSLTPPPPPQASQSLALPLSHVIPPVRQGAKSKSELPCTSDL